MDEIKDRVFLNDTVRLDRKLFVDCSFEDCLLQYGGRCDWERTRFSNCCVELDAQANNTIQVLQGLGFSVVPRTYRPSLRWVQ